MSATADEGQKPAAPQIRRITIADVGAALAAGVRDFATAPLYGLFFGGFYAAAGLLLLALLFLLDLHFLVYPLAAGFALVAPFVASGVYEVSRRLEAGETLSWTGVFTAILRGGGRDMGWMAIVTTFSLIIWIDIAAFVYLMFFGLHPLGLSELFEAVTTTFDGALFLLIGNATGAFLAFAVFSLTVISFPLLLHRDLDFVTAMIASVQSVFRNPVPMLLWALIILACLTVCVLSLFLGLLVFLPVLGHASWHLYRRVIE